jgi:hypothetical protein
MTTEQQTERQTFVDLRGGPWDGARIPWDGGFQIEIPACPVDEAQGYTFSVYALGRDDDGTIFGEWGDRPF